MADKQELYLRNGLYYCNVRIAGQRIRRALNTADLAEAERELSRIKGRLDVGDDLREWTLQDAFDYLFQRGQDWEGQERSGGQPLQARLMLKLLGPALPVKAVSESHLALIVEDGLEAGLAESTINRRLSAVSKLLTLAKAKKKLHDRPVFPRFKELPNPKALTDEQVEQLLAMEANAHYKLLWTFLLETGCRLGEALNTPWQWFDWRGQSWVIPAEARKVHRAVALPLSDDVCVAVRRLQEHGLTKPFPVTKSAVLTHWWAVRDRLAAQYGSHWLEVSPHKLRHTCATRLLNNGAQVTDVKEWLGHTNIQTTMRYLTISSERLRSRLVTVPTVTGSVTAGSQISSFMGKSGRPKVNRNANGTL